MGKAKILLFIFLFSFLGTKAQDHNEIRAVNNYITFINESIHGLLIAHRLFEIYNQTVNKYVDLPEYQLNNYSNDDLPDDIFEDPEKWFYEKDNPYQLYASALRESHFLHSDVATLNQHVDELKRLLGVFNTKRITIDRLLENSDFSQISNLQKMYQELEGVVALYDRFYEVYKAIDKHFQSVYSNLKRNSEFSKTFSELNVLIKSQAEKVRYEGNLETGEINQVNSKVSALEKIKLNGESKSRKRILTNASRLVGALTDYKSGKGVPKEYELHGDHYHYHNVSFLNLTNRYGNGFVNEYNILAQENGWMKEMEIPHFYKVIYPKKLPKEELTTLDDNKLIAILNKKEAPIETPKPALVTVVKTPEKEIPPQAKKEKEKLPPIDYDRGIVVHEEVIMVNTDSFDLELYDHLIKDGDRVSIKVNDEWKFKNISLEKEARVVTIHIKPGQQNYILVHADNTGFRPPNTIAIAYTVNGERKEINLKTDLENSQMVEIKYQ